MKVLLLQDVKKLGKQGEIVEVSDGYAKNYIIPKKLGKEANNAVLNEFNLKKGAEANRKEKERAEAIANAEKISKLTVTIREKAGADGRLFGSVTSKDLMEELKKQHDVAIDRKKILLKDPIRAVGNYSVDIHLHKDATAHLTVQILPKE